MFAMPPTFTMTRCRSGRANKRGVKRGHEWRALPARRDVAAAKIGDDDHSRLLGNARRIVELHGESAIGPMAQRLAMHAGGADVGSRDFRSRQCAGDRFRVQLGQHVRRSAGARQLVVARLLQREQLVAQQARKSDMRGAERFAGLVAFGREIGDDGIDAVEAGPGHHAGE